MHTHSLETVPLGRNILQILLQSLTELSQLLLGHLHLLTNQVEGLQGERKRQIIRKHNKKISGTVPRKQKGYKETNWLMSAILNHRH